MTVQVDGCGIFMRIKKFEAEFFVIILPNRKDLILFLVFNGGFQNFGSRANKFVKKSVGHGKGFTFRCKQTT